MKRESEFRYLQLANILREQILSGYIKPGEYLLSENELCKYYDLSRTSVRKSLEQLQKEGLIVKKMGQGTMVSPDVVIEEQKPKLLRILTTSPSHFVDHCMPLLIESFRREHPHVQVKLLSFPTLDFWESIRMCSEMGLHADLVFVSDRQYAELESTDAFHDLQPMLQDSLPLMYPCLVEAFRQQQSLKAVPITFSTVYLAYNPDLFDRYEVDHPSPHWVKEDFMRAAQKLTVDTDGDGIVDLYGIALSSALSRWPVIALQNGVDFNNLAAGAPLTKTLTFLHDLIYRYRVATLFQSAKYRMNSEAFARRKAAMVLTTSIELAGWRNDTMDFEPQVAPLPFGDRKSTLLVANAFMMPTSGENSDLAASFLQFAFRPDVQRQIARETHFLSVEEAVNREVWDKPFLESLNIIDDQIKNSYFLHELCSDPAKLEEIQGEMELFWAGLESAASLAERIVKLIGGK